MEFKLFSKVLTLALGNLFIAPAMASPFDGFNIELLGGESTLQAKTLAQAATPVAQLPLPPPLPTILTEIYNHHATLTTNNGIGELRFGYGRVLCNSCFFIGGELFGNYSHPEFSSHQVYAQTPLDIFPNRTTIERAKFKLNSFEYGADIKPGYLLSPTTLLVGRIGVAFNRLKIHDSSEVFFPNDDFDVINHLNKDDDKAGLLLGLGLEQYLCRGFSINVDYTYTTYNRSSFDNTSDVTIISRTPAAFFDVADGVAQHIDSRIHNNKFMLGINYHFQPPCSRAYIDNSDYCQAMFTGLYAGLSAGDLNMRARVKGDTSFGLVLSPVTGVTSDTFLQNVTVASDAFIGELSFGYGKQFCRFYLGAQAFFNEADRNLTSDKNYVNGLIDRPADPNDPDALLFPAHYTTSSKVRLSNGEFGVDLMPGFLLTPKTLATLRVGAAFNNLELRNFNHYDNVPDIGFLVENDLEASKNKHETSLRLGFGLRQYICNGLSITADYIYTDYGHLHADAITESFALTGAGIITIPEGFTTHEKVHVSTQAILLGLNYRFGSCRY